MAIIRDILTTKNFVTKVERILTLILIVRKDGVKQQRLVKSDKTIQYKTRTNNKMDREETRL